MIKSELRRIYLEKQRELSADIRHEQSKRIADELFGNFDFRSFKVVHCFISIEKFGEIETRPIFERIWTDFSLIKTVVPRVDVQKNEMLSLRFTGETKLKPNDWQILEPGLDESVDAATIDLVLVPGVAFDLSGHRVGYGKGFYDRFLAKCRPDCVKAGLSFFPPVDTIDDIHDGDISLDFCITPDKAYRSEAGRLV